MDDGTKGKLMELDPMRLLVSVAFFGLFAGASYAGPIDDSQALYDALAGFAPTVQEAIDAPVSRPFARELESSVYQPIKNAWQTWDSNAMASGNYRSYSEFQPCLLAGQLLGYVADEVIQHHLGNDQYEGTMKYRHAQPFVERLEQCKVQIEAARAEVAADAS